MSRIWAPAAAFWLAVSPALALEVPKLERRVTDLAGLLEPSQSDALETRLKELENTDSTQIAVLILPSLEGEALEDFSERTASAWSLGQKGRDNGALLLVAMRERKLRIEVGYGLEGSLTDARSRRIIETEILPRFRQQDFSGGIDAGVAAIIATVRGTYQPSEPPRKASPSRKSFDWLIFLLIPILWFLSATGKWGGGALGSGAGAYITYLLFGARLLPILGGGALGSLAQYFPPRADDQNELPTEVR